MGQQVSLRAALLAGFSLAVIAQAQAQSAPPAPDNAEQIVVVARKRAEKLQNVPVSITVLSAQKIQEDDVRNIGDIAHLTPGLIYDQGINANDTRPSIRGISDQRGRPGVAILEDGVDISGQSIMFAGGGSLIDTDLLDLAQIEVVKGPQTVFYGRNAFSGAINYITKQPSATWEGFFEDGIAQGGLYEERAGISGPITDTLRMRANVASKDFGGFYTNQVDGKGVGGSASRGGLLELAFQPNSAFSALLRGEFTHSTDQQRAAVLDGGTFGSLTTINGQGVYIGTLTANPKNVRYAPHLPGLKENTAKFALDLKYDYGWATLASVTSFITDAETDKEEADFSMLPGSSFGTRQFAGVKQQNIQVSQDVRLSSVTGGRLTWMGGLYYYHEYATALDDGILSATSCVPFASFLTFIPGFPCSAPDGTPSHANPVQDVEFQRQTDHYSVYGSAGYEVLPKFNITAEARYAIERITASQPGYSRELASYGFQSEDGGYPLTYAPSGALALIPPEISATITSYDFVPRFSADYHFTDDLMAYASASKGTKPAGVNQVIGTTDRYDIGRYKEEKLWSYEVGLKSAFMEGAVIVNADLFYMDYKNQQNLLQLLVAGTPFPISTVQNIGQSYSEGLELAAAYKPLPPVTLAINYTYDRARIESFDDNTTQALALFPPYGSLKGKRVPGAPVNTLNVTARYDGHFDDTTKYFLDAVTTYESDRFINGDPYNFKRLAPFAQEDFRIGVSHGRYSLEAYCINAFDDLTVRNGISYLNVSGSFQDAAVAYLTNPRQFGGMLRIKF